MDMETKMDLIDTPDQVQQLPLVVYENSEHRHERREKRQFWLIVILIALLFGTNLCWLLYEMQFQTVETVTTTIDTTDGGDANYIGNDGSIVNGAD